MTGPDVRVRPRRDSERGAGEGEAGRCPGKCGTSGEMGLKRMPAGAMPAPGRCRVLSARMGTRACPGAEQHLPPRLLGR